MSVNISTQLFNVLPEDGSPITGKQLKELLPAVSSSDLKEAKQELKASGRVTLGRGRGGKIARVTGAEAPEEKKVSAQERMAYAREEKAANTKEAKQMAAIREAAQEQVRNQFPDAKFEGDKASWVEPNYPLDGSYRVYVRDEKASRWNQFAGQVDV